MSEIISFCITGRPKSSQSSRRDKYQAKIRDKAIEVLGEDYIIPDARFYVRIIWSHSIPVQGDIDNIIKPILDSMNGVVFTDDRDVIRVMSQRVDIRGGYTLSLPTDTALSKGAEEYLELATTNSFIYIEVGKVTDNIGNVFGRINLGEL